MGNQGKMERNLKVCVEVQNNEKYVAWAKCIAVTKTCNQPKPPKTNVTVTQHHTDGDEHKYCIYGSLWLVLGGSMF